MITEIPFIVGYATLQSDLSIEEVGLLLSSKIFGGLEFSGKHLEIHEEIPAIFINTLLLGLRIVLDGYSGFGPDQNFTLPISPWITFAGKKYEEVRLDGYLTELLRNQLADNKEIIVLD
jgi:hypothetical protein